MALIVALPCRVAIYQDPNDPNLVHVSMVRVTETLKIFEESKDVAESVSSELIAIVEDAIKM